MDPILPDVICIFAPNEDAAVHEAGRLSREQFAGAQVHWRYMGPDDPATKQVVIDSGAPFVVVT